MTAKLHLANLIDEPADGTVLVVRIHDTYSVIERNDSEGSEQSKFDDERWFDASDVDARPVTWRSALDYADEVFPLGVALNGTPAPAPVGAPAEESA